MYSSTPTPLLLPPSHLRSLPGLSCPCVHDLLSSVQQSVSTGFWERRTVMSYSHHRLKVMVVVKGGMITYHHHHYHWTILSRKPPDVWAAATNWSPTFTREWGEAEMLWKNTWADMLAWWWWGDREPTLVFLSWIVCNPSVGHNDVLSAARNYQEITARIRNDKQIAQSSPAHMLTVWAVEDLVSWSWLVWPSYLGRTDVVYKTSVVSNYLMYQDGVEQFNLKINHFIMLPYKSKHFLLSFTEIFIVTKSLPLV